MMSSDPRRFSVVSTFFTLAASALISTAAYAQTDYFWNNTGLASTSGGTGTWDLGTQNWSPTTAQPTPAVNQNTYTWTNSGTERANFGNVGTTAGTVTLGSNITAYGINFGTTANYVIAGGGNTLTLAGTGGVINAGVAATISAPINGSVGLTKTGGSTLTLSGANIYSGTTTVAGGTLIGVPQVSGSPFSSGPITLTNAALKLSSLTVSTTTTTTGDLTVSGATGNNLGAASLTVDNANGAPSTTLAASNLLRGGAGSALVITPQQGLLGTKEILTFGNGSSLVTNGILPPWVVKTVSGSNLAADFVSYGTGAPAADYNHNGVVDAADYVLWRKDPANNGGAGGYTPWRQTFGNSGGGGTGVSVATYTSNDLTTSTNASVVDQSTAPTITGSVAAYALKTNQAINLGGNTLTLGNGSGQSGLILNGGASVTGGAISFGSTEGMIFSQGNTTLGSAGSNITSNGMTITGLGATTVTINGNVVDGTAPARLALTGATSQSTLVLNGNNTYSGGTILGVNNSAAAGLGISVGSDTAFGTGKVTNVLLPGTSSPTMQATGAARTLTNAFDLNGGLTFNGANNLTFNGPITIINSAAGGTRTLNNTMTTATSTVTYGASPGSSTITLGNPVSNGGDGVGKGLALAGSTITGTAGPLTIVNDVIQDAGPGGGTAAGSVTISAGGGTNAIPGPTVSLNAMNTYSGGTTLSGVATLIPVVNDSIGAPGSITAGPFGTGQINFNNGTNQHVRPSGGNRTIANAILLTTGMAMDNGAGESFNLTLSGPVTMTNNRFISNGFVAGTTGGSLIMGDPNAPSTITLPVVGTNFTLSFAALSGQIVVNDVIQDGSGAAGIVNFNTNSNNNNPITINALNTYTGGSTIGVNGFGNVQFSTSSNGDNGAATAGPFGTGTLTSSSTAGTTPALVPLGADRTISNTVTLNGNLGAANAAGQTFNLNLTGPISLGSTGRSIKNNMAGTLTLGQSTAAASTNAITLSGTALINLTFSGANTSTTVVNDVIQNGGGGIIPGNVTVSSSVVQFNNANTYGPSTPGTATSTIVSGTGKLLVNNTSGSGTGTGNVSVTGGTLGGNGTISQSVTASGGAIAPGNTGAGTLNVGGKVTFSGTGGLTVDVGGTIAGTDYDQLLVGDIADLSAGGKLTVNVIGAFTDPADFTILTATNGLTLGGGGSGFTSFSYPGAGWSVTYSSNSVVLHHVASGSGSGLAYSGAVPEPGTLSLLMFAVGSGLLTSIRRRRS